MSSDVRVVDMAGAVEVDSVVLDAYVSLRSPCRSPVSSPRAAAGHATVVAPTASAIAMRLFRPPADAGVSFDEPAVGRVRMRPGERKGTRHPSRALSARTSQHQRPGAEPAKVLDAF